MAIREMRSALRHAAGRSSSATVPGYRAGIHMKEYKEKVPVLVIGGSAGSFLGEYQAGGIILVLGLGARGLPVGDFAATGMHGGRIFLRKPMEGLRLPPQVIVSDAAEGDLSEIEGHISEFCQLFHEDFYGIMSNGFFVLKPNTKNLYKTLYVAN